MGTNGFSERAKTNKIFSSINGISDVNTSKENDIDKGIVVELKKMT